MEFMVAVYPAVKLFAMILVVVVAVLLYKAKKHKLNMAWGILWLLFFYLAPVKVDGTQSKAAHKAEVTQANSYYEEHALASDAKPVKTIKLTFEQRMAAEDARSKAKNQEVTDEINK